MAYIAVPKDAIPTSIICNNNVYVPMDGGTGEVPAECMTKFNALQTKPAALTVPPTVPKAPGAATNGGASNGNGGEVTTPVGGTMVDVRGAVNPNEGLPRESLSEQDATPVISQSVAEGRPMSEPEGSVGGDDVPGFEAPAASSGELAGVLPVTFPGYKALADAGYTTYEQIRLIDPLDVDGIGDATANKIQEALGGNG